MQSSSWPDAFSGYGYERRKCLPWGAIGSGKLGLFDEEDLKEKEKNHYSQTTPKQVPFPDYIGKDRIVDITCGDETSFAVTNNGKVFSWGYNPYRQTGHTSNNEMIYLPRMVDVAKTAIMGNKNDKTKYAVQTAASGGQHSLFLVKRYN